MTTAWVITRNLYTPDHEVVAIARGRVTREEMKRTVEILYATLYGSVQSLLSFARYDNPVAGAEAFEVPNYVDPVFICGHSFPFLTAEFVREVVLYEENGEQRLQWRLSDYVENPTSSNPRVDPGIIVSARVVVPLLGSR